MAAIFRRHGPAYRARHRLPHAQLRVMRAIETCRTAALGGHVEQCGQCQHRRISYNSCRNRHCPKCQHGARAEWVERRKGELLPIEYFHVVFTIPQELAAVALQNPEVVYSILFDASARTLQTIAADGRHLGARIGFFSILHTWGQNLLHHPHVHCVVTGGGLSLDGTAWVSCRRGFFLSVRVLSRLFRRLFVEALEAAFSVGRLHFYGTLEALTTTLPQRLAALAENEWVVYAKPPFGGPQQVIDYLGRYTHRVAISNERLRQITDEQVTFDYRDHHAKNRYKLRRMTLRAEEFLRRFLLHTLPSGFQRIRYYGLLAGCNKKRCLALCRALLGAATHWLPTDAQVSQSLRALVPREPLCPLCGQGRMIRLEAIPANPFAIPAEPVTELTPADTS